jgi:ornithine--oxo-acid transaminase
MSDVTALDSPAVATNYHPLPVVVTRASGAWVEDDHGRALLDCLAAYSANNFGHRHPDLVRALQDQLGRVTLVSRAFHDDQLGPFCEELADLVGQDVVLPMNTGAEAVETAIKIARKWGYTVKGVPHDEANIVVAHHNFHGRTTTIVGFSDDPLAYADYGPFTPGFRRVPFGDVPAVQAAIDDNTVAVLLEPIQGEAGVIVPPPGFLAGVRAACTERGVVLITDEVQSGLCRTGRLLAADHEGVSADLVVLGKSLGGGLLPVSAVAGRREVMRVITPGTHGSTFGGNALAAAVGRAVVELIRAGGWNERATALGARLTAGLVELKQHGLVAVRSRGLWAGIDIDPAVGTGRHVCEQLLEQRILAKDCHGHTIRLAPPLVASEDDVDFLLAGLRAVLA